MVDSIHKQVDGCVMWCAGRLHSVQTQNSAPSLYVIHKRKVRLDIEYPQSVLGSRHRIF